MRLVLDGPAGAPAAPHTAGEDGPPPAPAGHVVVAMEWGGLNRIDRMLIDGHVPKPAGEHVLGAQGSGRVHAVGEGVEGLAPGDLVALYCYGGCGACEACEDGNDTLCATARLDGVNAPGMLRRWYVAEARDVLAVPDGMSPRMAALATTMAVAWHVLVCRGGLRAGETVGVCTITSGLGACCGALADQLGARVVGLARAATLEHLGPLPAWVAQTWATDADTEARPPRVELAVDMVGAPTLPVVHRMVRTGGRIVSVGAHAGGDCRLDLWRLFVREQDLRGSHGCHRADAWRAIDALSRLGEEGLVDSCFALEDFARAYERLDTPGRFGNVLLDLAS